MAPFPTLTAREMCEERAELYQWLTDPGQYGGQKSWAYGFGPQVALLEQRSARRWSASLHSADLTYVDRNLTRTALAAGDAFDEFSLDECDITSPHGLVAFEEPITAPMHLTYVTGMAITAASWAVHGNLVEVRWWTDKNSWVKDYADTNQMKPAERRVLHLMHPTKLVAVGHSGIKFGERDRWPEPDLRDEYEPQASKKMVEEYKLAGRRLVEAEKTLIATWLLMNQTLTVETRVQTPRAAMARIGRIDPALLGTVRQVTLRHKNIAPDQRGEVDGPKREYAHRWCVKGHWRKRTRDPKPGESRKIWVPWHLKGPEGAPILDPSKLVNVLRR